MTTATSHMAIRPKRSPTCSRSTGRNGKNIDVQVIDPVTEKDKLAKLHDQLVQRLWQPDPELQGFPRRVGQAVQGVRTTLTDAGRRDDRKVTGGGAHRRRRGRRAQQLRLQRGRGAHDQGASQVALPTCRSDLDAASERRNIRTGRPPPNTVKDYPADGSRRLSGRSADAVRQVQGQQKPSRKTFASTWPQSQPRYAADQEVCRRSDREAVETRGAEGRSARAGVERQQSRCSCSGPTDWRVLQYNQMWPEDTDLRNMVGGKVRPRFAGEQQVTAAIYSLTTNKKPKVCFVRPGGEPVTQRRFPAFHPVRAAVADRRPDAAIQLRDSREGPLGDLGDAGADAAACRRRPSRRDEEIKDAIWVVLDMPRSFGAGQAGHAARADRAEGQGASRPWRLGADPL